MATNNLNPFYIEPSNEESGWQYDADDLDELLEHDSSPPAYHSPRSRGRLPVPNLAYDDDVSSIRHRRRLRLVLLGVIALAIAWTVVTQKSKSTNVVDKPTGGGRFNDDDENDDRPSQTHQQPPVSKVHAIVTLGERNSGLSWLTAKLQTCYPDLSVKSGFSREGTWFQDDDPNNNAATLIVSVFDNPYDWVEQMRLHPEYAPSHASMTSWDSFVTKPWTLDNYQQATATQQCQLGFAPDQVVPCKADETPSSKPAVYELDPSNGSVFPNIVDLRAAKIRHFVQEVSRFQHVLGVITVQYERLVGDALDAQHKHSGLPGLLTTLNQIKEQSGGGLEYECDLVADKSLFAKPVGNHKTLRQPYVEWMNAHVDWEAEALVGYSKWDTIPPSQVSWSESNPEGLAEDDDGFAENDDDQTKDDGGGRDITDTQAPTASPSAVPTNAGPESTESPTAAPSSAKQESTDLPTASPSVAADTNVEPVESSTRSPSESPSATATDSTAEEQPSAAPTGMSAATEAPTAVEQHTETPTSSPSSVEPAADTSSTTAPTAINAEPADSISQTPAPTSSPSTTTTTDAPTNNENNVRRRR